MVVAGSLTSWLARKLAGWPNDGEADWQTGWLSSCSGNGLEVLSGGKANVLALC